MNTTNTETKITAALSELLRLTSDCDVREASEAWGRRDHETAFDALDRAAEHFDAHDDMDHAESAEWIREEIDALA